MRRSAVLIGASLTAAAAPGAAQTVQTQGSQSPAVNAPGGNVTITYAGMSEAEKEAFAKQVADKLLAEMRTSGVA